MVKKTKGTRPVCPVCGKGFQLGRVPPLHILCKTCKNPTHRRCTPTPRNDDGFLCVKCMPANAPSPTLPPPPRARGLGAPVVPLPPQHTESPTLPTLSPPAISQPPPPSSSSCPPVLTCPHGQPLMRPSPPTSRSSGLKTCQQGPGWAARNACCDESLLEETVEETHGGEAARLSKP